MAVLAAPMALASSLKVAKSIPKLVFASFVGLWPTLTQMRGLFYNLWLFRPPNCVLVTQRSTFWISAGRELSGVILSINQYCGIILLAFHALRSSLSTKIKIQEQSIWNIWPPFKESSFHSPDYPSLPGRVSGAKEHSFFWSANLLYMPCYESNQRNIH